MGTIIIGRGFVKVFGFWFAGIVLMMIDCVFLCSNCLDCFYYCFLVVIDFAETID